MRMRILRKKMPLALSLSSSPNLSPRPPRVMPANAVASSAAVPIGSIGGWLKQAACPISLAPAGPLALSPSAVVPVR